MGSHWEYSGLGNGNPTISDVVLFPFGETKDYPSNYQVILKLSMSLAITSYSHDVRPHVPKDRLLAIVHQVGIWPRLFPLPRRAMDTHAVKAVPVQKN
jgi:hypothetical protein